MARKKSGLNLPKNYLSYSAYMSWQENPAEFRRHYYEGIKSPQTKEMKFGHDFAKGLEEGTIDHKALGLERYAVSEKRIMTEIDGVPILAFLDTFDPDTRAFRELKTGRRPWDAVRVHKHEQLPFYMLAILSAYGDYDKTTFLDWVGTRLTRGVEDFGGIEMESPDAGEVELTGEIQSFKRNIAQWELARMKRRIRGAAEAVSADYTDWQKVNGI